MEEGIIYVLTNPAMPNMVKIGKTTRAEVEIRMKELYSSSGVPLPFQCSFAGRVSDVAKVEKAFHEAFAPNRVNPKREFFEIEDSQAIALLKLLCDKDVTPTVSDELDKVDEASREASKAYEKRRPRFDFAFMGIPVGSILYSATNDAICTVAKNNKVMYGEEEMSFTEATRQMLDLDYNVQPGPRWTYEGKTVREYYQESY